MASAGMPDRPMEIGNVITMTFRAFKAHPWLLLGSSFVLSGLPQGLFVFVQDAGPVLLPELSGRFGGTALPWHLIAGWLLVVVLLFIPMTLLLQSIVSRATIAGINDERVTLGACLHVAVRRMLPLLGLMVLAAVAIGFGLILLIVPGIMLMVIWYVATPAVVLERCGVTESLSRSADLTRGARWMVFLTAIVLVFVTTTIGSIGGSVRLVSSVSALASGGDPTASIAAFAPLSALVYALTVTVTTLLSTIVPIAVYAELLDRLEGPRVDTLKNVFA